jgi:acetyl-CoA carboxylase carboxyltransferase component
MASMLIQHLSLRADNPGSLSAAIEDLDGRRCVVVRSDAAHARGALRPSDGELFADAARHAYSNRLPLIAFLASSGADVSEGIAALHGWGGAARDIVRCSGVVPIIFALDGPAVSGTALLIGLADFVVMTKQAYAFVSGPNMVRMMTGIEIDVDDLGGGSTHARQTGVAALTVGTLEDAEDAVAELLNFLPDHVDEPAPFVACSDAVDQPIEAFRDLIPDSPTGSYDVKHAIQLMCDDEYFLEIRSSWAPNIVTGFGYIGGHPVGIVGNQPMSIAGTLDIPSSQKGARFVGTCDAFGIPLVTLVDTPGFYPGKDLEWRGMIRHGAQLAFAYARATVPRICVVLRKSYGGAYIVMDSKAMGNDICLAWPTAEIAVMGAKGAAEILHRRATPEERAAHEAEYEDQLLNPYIAAERGLVDDVIDPAQTRCAVAAALDLLFGKREKLVRRRHDNIPL